MLKRSAMVIGVLMCLVSSVALAVPARQGACAGDCQLAQLLTRLVAAAERQNRYAAVALAKDQPLSAFATGAVALDLAAGYNPQLVYENTTGDVVVLHIAFVLYQGARDFPDSYAYLSSVSDDPTVLPYVVLDNTPTTLVLDPGDSLYVLAGNVHGALDPEQGYVASLVWRAVAPVVL